MKIQCNACEAGEANVLCCADEAALCWACDDKIHAANKLASKHQRVPLSSWSSQMPKCDICQETVGYFFCLEDRALLCRKCDVGIHTANSYVAGHQRFLLTGVKVGLEAAESGGSNVKEKSNVVEKVAETTSSVSMPTKGPLIGESNDLPFAGITIPTGIPDWHLDEFLGLSDVNQSYGVADTGSSKADCMGLRGSEWYPFLQVAKEEQLGNEYMINGPDFCWTVPQMVFSAQPPDD